MSCQHVSRLITTAATSVLSEDQDPYVFTETVPTTPPILFNAQVLIAPNIIFFLESHFIGN